MSTPNIPICYTFCQLKSALDSALSWNASWREDSLSVLCLLLGRSQATSAAPQHKKIKEKEGIANNCCGRLSKPNCKTAGSWLRHNMKCWSRVLRFWLIAIAICASLLIHHQLTNRMIKEDPWPFSYNFDVRNDQAIVDFIRRQVLVHLFKGSYTLDKPERNDSSFGKMISRVIVPKYFKGKVDKGVFFEAGALDGEYSSNTLYLEKELGWSGMLVEMNPLVLEKMYNKRRKAYHAPVCLSPLPWPIKADMKVFFHPSDIRTSLGATISQKKQVNDQGWNNKNQGEMYAGFSAKVDCYPIQTLLLAANITSLDLLSLDLEGVELKVLKTIDWKVISVKVILLDLLHTEEGFNATKRYLTSNGFTHVHGDGGQVVFLNSSIYSATSL